MKISDILYKEHVLVNVSANEKSEIIDTLINLFQDDKRISDLEQVRSAVQEREKIMSTGVGNGFAIPHAKCSGVKEMIAGFAKLAEPMDFKSLDEKPVNLIFLLVGRESAVGPHIKMLSRISRIMNKESFREALSKAETVEEAYNLFIEEEKNFFELS